MRGRRLAEVILVGLTVWMPGCQERPVSPRGTVVNEAPVAVQTKAEMPGGPAPVTSVLPEERFKNPCRIRELIWDDASEPAVSSMLPSREWMESLAQEVFGGFDASGDRFVLEVRVATTVESSVPQRGHFGSVGFLVGKGRLSGRVLETRQQVDWGIPAQTPGSEGVDPGRALVQEALRRQTEVLRGACQISFARDDAIPGWFDHPWWELRRAAAAEAGERGNASHAEGLLRLTRDERREVVLAAIASLGRVDSSDATVEALMALSSRTDEPVILAVVTALAMMDSPVSRRYLKSLSVGHPLAEIRLRAGQLLENLH